MKIIRKSSSAEMILEWLKAELISSRFSSDLKNAIKELGTDENIITNADLDSTEENEKRLSILKKYRGWFELDVDTYDWQLAELDQDEAGKLKYIDYDYWNELSSQTGLVEKAAQNVKQGMVVFNVPNDAMLSIAKAAESGGDFPPIIVVSKKDEGEIIEGHLRATGYVLAGSVSKPLNAIVGIPRV